MGTFTLNNFQTISSTPLWFSSERQQKTMLFLEYLTSEPLKTQNPINIFANQIQTTFVGDLKPDFWIYFCQIRFQVSSFILIDWIWICVNSSFKVPVYDAAMHNFKDDNSFCAVFEEVRHALLKGWFDFVFGDDLQVVPGCFAAALHLT